MPACCRPTSLDDPTSRDQIQRTFSCRDWNLPPTTPTCRATSEPHEQLQWHRLAGSRAEPPAAVEMMMHLSVDVAGTSELNCEAWRALLRSTGGGKPQAIEPNDFVGSMRPRSVYRL